MGGKKKEGPPYGEKSDVVGLRAIRAAWRFNERVNVWMNEKMI